MLKAIIFDIHGTLIQPGSHQPFDRAAQVLASLSEKYKLAYATSWSAARVRAILGEFDLLKYFSAQAYDSEVEYGKPAPDVYLLAAERLGIDVDDCVLVEDGESCIEEAKKAGFKCIAHKSNGGQHFEAADFVITNLLELEEIVNSL